MLSTVVEEIQTDQGLNQSQGSSWFNIVYRNFEEEKVLINEPRLNSYATKLSLYRDLKNKTNWCILNLVNQVQFSLQLRVMINPSIILPACILVTPT